VGIYDRDYYRQERPGFSLAMPRSAVATLILVNVAVFLAEILSPVVHRTSTGEEVHWVEQYLSASPATLTQPWLWWQFLTYGFVHAPNKLTHILFNMLALWFLGRDVERVCGSKEFTRLYLVLLVVGSVAWAAINRVAHSPGGMLMGASGAVTGVVVLYAMNFPHRIILLMFVLPVPAWVLGVIIVAFDILGSLGGETNVAYSVHLVGAAFAFLYARQRWNFGRLLPDGLRWPRWQRRQRLRVHKPDEEEDSEGVPEDQVDRILEKIYREGETSLTRQERRILETASRAYQRRRRSDE
jgi:membrane associated rhomboid family serine protease